MNNGENDEKLSTSWKNDFDNIYDSKVKYEEVNYETETFVSCELCEYKTTKVHYMEWHIESFHEFNVLSCHLCEFTSQFSNNIEDHIKYFHSESSMMDSKIVEPNEDLKKCEILNNKDLSLIHI